jgi:AcrR family transcriptional regulator
MTAQQDTERRPATAQLPDTLQPEPAAAPAQRHGDPLRADARQNRDKIIEVARDALAASADASLNSIAKRAGVGAGTLYRHFPTREALVLAVYGYDVQQLAGAAPALLAEHPPLVALRLWLDRLAHYGRIRNGLTGAMRQLLTACEQAGCIRAGLDPDDVLLLAGFLWRVDEGDAAAAKADRLLGLVMDGLRAGAPAAAPRMRWFRRRPRGARPQGQPGG